MQKEYKQLNYFFKINKKILNNNIDYIFHQSIFDDMNGCYFLKSIYKENGYKKKSISDDFDILCEKNKIETMP